jgi:hypothetical protein
MKTLNQLIDALILLRDANPTLGDMPAVMEDQEYGGSEYTIDICDIKSDATGTILTCR